MNDQIDYHEVMQEALLHGVVRETLNKVQQNGLPGDHHFYIAFLTHFPGVEISDELKTQYPEEMIIVLQHRFWNLDVQQDYFEVDLTFNEIMHRLHIPFAAVRAFFDPSVDFGLQFDIGEPDEDEEDDFDYGPAQVAAAGSDGYGQVLKLDAFRKK